MMSADLNQQQQIIAELITTEQNYVKDLQDICEVYLPCFSILHKITSDDINTVFSNVDSILSISRLLLKDLISSGHDLVKLAESFLDRASDFRQYSSYCTSYHRANERLYDLKEKNPLLATILLDLQRSLGHALPLSSYLHKPVQRILKYHLILKNLLKYPDDDDVSKPYLNDAYECMAKCAEEINNCKRLTEMDVKTRELHELLLAVRETDHFGKLIREGEMTLEARGSSAGSRTMFLYLFENVLVLCHKINGDFTLHTILRCPELVILEDNTKKELEFTLLPFSSPSQALTLRAKTLAQKLDWCIQLHKLTAKNIPSKAKKLLLSSNDSLKLGPASPCYSKQVKRKPSLTLPLLSPTSLGRRVKRRMRSGVTGILTRSKSTINLRRSSSTTSAGSCNQDSAYDSMSLKSDFSYSSDRLSSISSTCSPRPMGHEKSYDELSHHASELSSEMERGNVSHWHHLLVTRMSQLYKTQQPELPEYSSRVRRARSCIEMTTPRRDTEAIKYTHSAYSRCQSTQERPAEPSPKTNMFESKSHFLQKVIRWRRRANKNQAKSSHTIEKATPIECSQQEQTIAEMTMKPVPTSGLCSPTVSRDSIYCDKRLSSSDEREETDRDSVFNLNISDNFSDSLIECFNTVLQTSVS